MMFGLGLGLIVAIGVYLRTPSTPTAAATNIAAAPARTSNDAPTQSARPTTTRTPAAEERFSFYEVLPEFEVVVTETEKPAAATPAAAVARRTPPETPGSFLLQAGSFSAAADADRLQASLALLGFESHVQRVTIEDDVFNRVRIGPIGDLDAAKRTQRRLRDAGVDTLLMKVPN
jgi:cell division protein FtsN